MLYSLFFPILRFHHNLSLFVFVVFIVFIVFIVCGWGNTKKKKKGKVGVRFQFPNYIDERVQK